MQQPIIGIIGAAHASVKGCELAEQVGALLAEHKCTIVCGGLGGIMTAAARGCTQAGGTVLGILPGADVAAANPYVTYPIATNMGHARNIIIAHSAQALIAIEGELGTLSEIAIGLKLNKPVFALNCQHHVAGLLTVTSPAEAVTAVLTAVAKDD
ncbi:MAG: TIGR00725 family protein [Desulfuromonadales bacterium]|nr:TIGR00725 family protein [Desulfuromonadales bacterium]MDT8423764.1 TIGR00725 family protein [Desulfuromonadales bacterium]